MRIDVLPRDPDDVAIPADVHPGNSNSYLRCGGPVLKYTTLATPRFCCRCGDPVAPAGPANSAGSIPESIIPTTSSAFLQDPVNRRPGNPALILTNY